MKQDHFQIISNGLQDGQDPDRVLRDLANRLQTPPAALRKFLESRPQPITVLDNAVAAEQFCKDLRDIGLHCEIHPVVLPVGGSFEPHPPAKVPVPDSAAGRTTGVYEMLWDCDYCGTKKLLGLSHRFCPTCASPQNSDKRYFPSEAERVAVQDHVYYGVDRVCAACNTPSSAKAEFCSQCGHPLTDAAQAKLRGMQADRAKQGGGASGDTAPKAGNKSLKKILLGGAGLTTAGVLTGVFWTHQLEVTLAGHSWMREIQIEDFRPRSRSEWCDRIPGDAYSVSRRQEVRSHKQVPDGEECGTENVDQGDGSYRVVERCQTKYRQEPVFDDMCDYTADRWEYTRSITAEGRDQRPYWPEVKLTQSGDCIGCEREAGRNQRYLVHLVGADDRFQCPLDHSRWHDAALHSKWRVNVGVVAGDARCDSLQAVE